MILGNGLQNNNAEGSSAFGTYASIFESHTQSHVTWFAQSTQCETCVIDHANSIM